MADPHAGPPEPKVVPIPSDFPVSWAAPADERLPWQFDPMHFPDPMPRLEGELWSGIYEAGMSPAFAGYELPVRARGTMFNDYHFMAIFPVIPPEEMEAQGQKAEAGRRLASAGVIAGADDVFHLGSDEVRAALAAGGDLQALITERKAELERYSAIAPPMLLGTDYGPPSDSPLSRSLGKFFGTPVAPAEEEGSLNGHPGSPGKIQGTAKVIGSLAEAAKLEQDDILVTGTTSPPWTPLFATAGAIVTDTGGILSHCAVVAREYRIPAVVGTGAATQMISDGQLLEVDGDGGTVRIVG